MLIEKKTLKSIELIHPMQQAHLVYRRLNLSPGMIQFKCFAVHQAIKRPRFPTMPRLMKRFQLLI